MDQLYLGKKTIKLLNIKHSIKNANHPFIMLKESNELFFRGKRNWR